MTCRENSACLSGLKEENSEKPKGRNNHWRPIYFAGLNENPGVGDIAKMVANLEIQFWNKSGSIQLTLTERKCLLTPKDDST